MTSCTSLVQDFTHGTVLTITCVFVRPLPYGINTDLDALDKHEKLVMKSFIVQGVFVTMAEPFVIHFDSKEHTKRRYYPNVNYLCYFMFSG